MTTETTNQVTQPVLDDKQKFIESLPEDLRQDPNMLKFNNYGDMAKSYIGLSKLMGADKNDILRVPKPEADEKEWNEYYQKLGRPEAPDKYALPKIEGVEFNEDVLKQFRELAYKNGMTAKQFESVMGWYAPMAQSILQQQKESMVNAEKNVKEELKKEWGAAYEQKVNKIDDIINLYDKDGVVFDKLGKAGLLGDADIWKFFERAANDLSESDGTKDGNPAKEQVMTPNQAQMEINKRFADAAWMKIYTDSNNPMQKHYVEEMTKLSKYVFGE